MTEAITKSSNFADAAEYQKCLVDGHEFEYLQSNKIDRSTREDEFFCVKCNIVIEEYQDIPREELEEDE